MIVKNANTRAQGGEHLVMLAHLRRRWSLSGREGFGFLSPSRRACEAGFNAFVEVKRLFSTTPEAKEVTGVTGRGLGLTGRVRSVAALCVVRALGFATGAFGPSRNQSVRSGTQRSRAWRSADRTRGASGHMRSDASGRDRSSLEPL
jgi:hypothetical protein